MLRCDGFDWPAYSKWPVYSKILSSPKTT